MRSASNLLIARHKAIIIILIVAFVIRASYLSSVGIHDILLYAGWSIRMAQHGFFSIYQQDATVIYGPLYLLWIGPLGLLWLKLGGSTTIEVASPFIVLLKFLPLLAELGMIVLAYVLFPVRSCLRWIVPMLLALYPGLIATTAFWGQIDALFTLPVLVAFVLLRKGHPRGAWGLFTLALLIKIQAIVALPLLFVLTLRRFGWKSLLISLSIMLILFLLFLAPFMIGSGVRIALTNPYLGALGQFPNVSMNALNLWSFATPSLWSSHPPLIVNFPPDVQPLISLITAKQLGLIMLALFVLLILVIVWRNADQPYEFIWLTALYFAFFMLPTEIHERYLYPAAICSLLALAVDRRMWIVALPTIFTFTYNMIFPSQAPFYWLGLNPLFILGDLTLPISFLNIVIFAALTYIILDRLSRNHPFPLKLLSAAILLIALLSVSHIVIPTPLPTTAQSLSATVDSTFQLQGYHLTQNDNDWSLDLYWKASAFNNTDYTLFVHAVRNGQIIAQDDERPQGGSYPTWRWFYNTWIVTEHKLKIPSTSPPDEIDVGMYNPSTMIRATATQNGQPLSDNAVHVWTG